MVHSNFHFFKTVHQTYRYTYSPNINLNLWNNNLGPLYAVQTAALTVL